MTDADDLQRVHRKFLSRPLVGIKSIALEEMALAIASLGAVLHVTETIFRESPSFKDIVPQYKA